MVRRRKNRDGSSFCPQGFCPVLMSHENKDARPGLAAILSAASAQNIIHGQIHWGNRHGDVPRMWYGSPDELRTEGNPIPHQHVPEYDDKHGRSEEAGVWTLTGAIKHTKITQHSTWLRHFSPSLFINESNPSGALFHGNLITCLNISAYRWVSLLTADGFVISPWQLTALPPFSLSQCCGSATFFRTFTQLAPPQK